MRGGERSGEKGKMRGKRRKEKSEKEKKKIEFVFRWFICEDLQKYTTKFT